MCSTHIQDMFARTPLALALMNGHSTVVGLLLGAKADASAQEESEDVLTPSQTTRSRRSRRHHKYSRKDSRRDSQILLQKQYSEKSSESGIERRHSKVLSLTSEAAASIGVASIASMSVSHVGTDLSVASQASRARSNSNHSIGHSVTFEEAADVTFFADSSSSVDNEVTLSFNLGGDPGSDEESGAAVCFDSQDPVPVRRPGEWMALAFMLGCLTGFLAHRLRS
ncbi:unnamed protein product [Symbiodinium natans]|uniref:Uncharacterized protein n=1 Tax=Symbiodinium natans TaxID=878477 RepID=A0A812T356_9DINO|nr:unnamed protein product [Symbiodinium natans]